MDKLVYSNASNYLGIYNQTWPNVINNNKVLLVRKHNNHTDFEREYTGIVLLRYDFEGILCPII